MRSTIAVSAAVLTAIALTACGSTKTVTSTVTSTLTTATQANTTTAAASTTSSTTSTTTQANSETKTCSVTGVNQVKGSTVSVKLTASGYSSQVANLVGCPTAAVLVKLIAAKKSQMPVATKNFQCTPTVTGSATVYACSLSAKDKGKIDYDFTLNYS